MINSQSQYRVQESQESCPQCRKKYTQSSSQLESESQERIVIPLRKQLIQNSNPQLQQIVKKLQSQVENLKRSNLEKDRVIEDLKKDMEHKMTHYMLFGEINKQSEEITKLRTQLTNRSRIADAKPNHEEVKKKDIAKLVKQQALKLREEKRSQQNRRMSDRYYSLIHGKSKRKEHSRGKIERENRQTERTQILGQYYETKPVFKISGAKKQIEELEKKNKFYENELIWMSNFVAIFVKTIQNIANKKYQQHILINQWNLKKKSKVCWRYLKHMLIHLYSE